MSQSLLSRSLGSRILLGDHSNHHAHAPTDHYKQLRMQAESEHTRFLELSMEAKSAHDAGSSTEAQLLDEVARKHKQRAHGLNCEAAIYVFRSNNATLLENEINLHGLLEIESLSVLDAHIRTLNPLEQQILRIVLEKDSQGPDVIVKHKAAVEQYLSKSAITWHSEKGNEHIIVALLQKSVQVAVDGVSKLSLVREVSTQGPGRTHAQNRHVRAKSTSTLSSSSFATSAALAAAANAQRRIQQRLSQPVQAPQSSEPDTNETVRHDSTAPNRSGRPLSVGIKRMSHVPVRSLFSFKSEPSSSRDMVHSVPTMQDPYKHQIQPQTPPILPESFVYQESHIPNFSPDTNILPPSPTTSPTDSFLTDLTDAKPKPGFKRYNVKRVPVGTYSKEPSADDFLNTGSEKSNINLISEAEISEVPTKIDTTKFTSPENVTVEKSSSEVESAGENSKIPRLTRSFTVKRVPVGSISSDKQLDSHIVVPPHMVDPGVVFSQSQGPVSDTLSSNLEPSQSEPHAIVRKAVLVQEEVPADFVTNVPSNKTNAWRFQNTRRNNRVTKALSQGTLMEPVVEAGNNPTKNRFISSVSQLLRRKDIE